MPALRPSNELALAGLYELITPDKVNKVPYRYLLVGAEGKLAVTRPDGTDIVTPTLPAGQYFFGECICVKSSGTTVASPGANVMGFY